MTDIRDVIIYGTLATLAGCFVVAATMLVVVLRRIWLNFFGVSVLPPFFTEEQNNGNNSSLGV